MIYDHEHDHDADDMTEHCPACDTANDPMGMVGTRVHYSCRDCGAWYSAKIEDVDWPQIAAETGLPLPLRR